LFSSKIKLLYPFILSLAKAYYWICFRHKVYGREHFYKGGAIIAANHTSYLDPPIVAISWPEEVHFLARDTLFDHFGFGSLIRALNAHPVSGDVSDVSVFKTICRLLKEGKKVVLFPEGERSYTDEMGEIKAGIGLLVTRSHAAIVPAYIHGARKAWQRGKPLPKLLGKTICVFGTAIRAEEFAHLEKRAAHQAIADRVTESILALKKWYLDGAKGTPP
jgi:1-acyl-sn-glycerol-3-phosphate acyltransferase